MYNPKIVYDYSNDFETQVFNLKIVYDFSNFVRGTIVNSNMLHNAVNEFEHILKFENNRQFFKFNSKTRCNSNILSNF